MKPSHWLDIDDNSQTNPDSAARTRFLYLALNDVAGFERPSIVVRLTRPVRVVSFSFRLAARSCPAANDLKNGFSGLKSIQHVPPVSSESRSIPHLCARLFRYCEACRSADGIRYRSPCIPQGQSTGPASG